MARSVSLRLCSDDGQSLTRPAAVKGFLHLFLTYKGRFFFCLRTPMRLRGAPLTFCLARSLWLRHVHPSRLPSCPLSARDRRRVLT